MVEPDDVRVVSGLMVSTAQQLPIATLVGDQKDGTALVEDVTADERCKLSHALCLPNYLGVQRPGSERKRGPGPPATAG
jgi:hypothetical protein